MKTVMTTTATTTESEQEISPNQTTSKIDRIDHDKWPTTSQTMTTCLQWYEAPPIPRHLPVRLLVANYYLSYPPSNYPTVEIRLRYGLKWIPKTKIAEAESESD